MAMLAPLLCARMRPISTASPDVFSRIFGRGAIRKVKRTQGFAGISVNYVDQVAAQMPGFTAIRLNGRRRLLGAPNAPALRGPLTFA